MGRTLPSITQAFLQEQEAFARFRRALRRSDQLILDEPFEIFLLAMLLEEHKQVLRLSRLLTDDFEQ